MCVVKDPKDVFGAVTMQAGATGYSHPVEGPILRISTGPTASCPAFSIIRAAFQLRN